MMQFVYRMRSGGARVSLFVALACLIHAVGGRADDSFSAYRQGIPGTQLEISMVPVSGGRFTMGSPEDEAGRNRAEGPARQVQGEDFWMGQYEIDWMQFEAFVYADEKTMQPLEPAALRALAIDGISGASTPYLDMSFGMGKEGYPAVNMTQYAALMYARWLSAHTGLFYRLPTEAEWEYACRAGTETPWSFGATPESAGDYAVTAANSDGQYAPVGSRKPNPWQLHDMHGNVAEWTLDQFDPDFYRTADASNPWNRPAALYPRVLRGGSWYGDILEARCAARAGSRPEWKDRDPQLPRSRWWFTTAPFVGFRLVRPRIQPPPEVIEEYWLEAIEDFGY